jgi:2,4-dienoyl-CoA reductase-like NADH-dependent reductase (Old Yellow Enzyme family)
LTEAVHQEGGRIVFQLAHAGRQTTKALIGKTPLGPSGVGRDPINLVKPKEMEAADIREVIKAFGVAAKRAHQAGADGIQLHAAHGYLINQFLSPFFNQRIDEWGGSEANRFRFLKEVLLEVKSVLPTGCPVLVKLNSRDYTPREGITPSLAATYAGWLADLGIQGLEVSCGSALYSFMNMCRGDVPVKEMAYSLPYWKRPIGTMMMKRLVGKYQLEEGYNLEAARLIKPVMGSIPLAVVGGWRTLAVMEETLERGPVDCISMSRPFIREPFIVKRFKEGKAEKVGCVSCNRCLAALVNNLPVQCYQKHFPLP